MGKNLAFVTINSKECYKISVFDHGLLYGDGVYETIRVFNGKAFLFEHHLDRLFASAKGIFLNAGYSKKDLIKMVKSAYRKSKLNDAFIRIIITRGAGEQGLITKSKPNVIIIISRRDFKPMEKISVTISRIRRIDRAAIDSKIKSLNYINNVLARFDANGKKFDDAILLNDKGMLTEATTSNLFIVKNGKLYSPPSSSGILEGVTRKAIIDNFPVAEKELTVNDLLTADESFLSGTVNFVSCIIKVNNKKFNNFDYAKRVYKQLMLLSKKGTLLK